MTESQVNIIQKHLPYWVITCKKGLTQSISIYKTEEELLRCKKKYEKDGYICSIEKKI